MESYALEEKYGLPYYWGNEEDYKNLDYVSIINSIDSSILFSKLSELNKEISNIARRFDDYINDISVPVMHFCKIFPDLLPLLEKEDKIFKEGSMKLNKKDGMITNESSKRWSARIVPGIEPPSSMDGAPKSQWLET